MTIDTKQVRLELLARYAQVAARGKKSETRGELAGLDFALGLLTPVSSVWTEPTPEERDGYMRRLAAAVGKTMWNNTGRDPLDGPYIGQKRPFGNSDIGGDVAEILGIDLTPLNANEEAHDENGWTPEFKAAYEYCENLWREWPEWLAAHFGDHTE